MQHYSQHRYAGTWQEHMVLGPQIADLSKQVIEELLILKRLTAFHISFGSLKEPFCLIQYNCLPHSSHHFWPHYKAVNFHISPLSAWLFSQASPPCTKSIHFFFCSPLCSSGVMETGWMLSSMTAYPPTTTSWSSPSPPSATSSGAPSWKRPMQSKANRGAVPASPARLCRGRCLNPCTQRLRAHREYTRLTNAFSHALELGMG